MNAFPIPDFQSFQTMSNGFPNGMDFMKQFWQQSQQSAAPTMPGMPSASPAFTQAMTQYLMPTLDVEEIDRRLNDLKTVLQFMELNTNMIRQSVQTLEVQRNTLATLQGMAQAAMPKTAPDAAPSPSDANPAQAWMSAWQNMLQGAQATMATAAQTAVSQTQEVMNQAAATSASVAKAASETSIKKAPAKKKST